MKKDKLFIYKKTKNNIDYYIVNPKYEIYIPAIDIETGNIEHKRITEYTIHKDLMLFKIEDSKNRFKSFWASDDHSLIVLNKNTFLYEKISPLEIIENPDLYYLIKTYLDKNNEYVKEFIPCNELNICFDRDKTIAADFTVEDYFTFATSDGILVQDTMAINVPLSKESIQEIKEKMIFPPQGQKTRSSSHSVGQGMNVAIYIITKDPDKTPILKYEEIKDEFKNNPEKILDYIIKFQNKNFRRSVLMPNKTITTLGRMLFRSFFPEEFRKNIEEKQYNKKSLLSLLDKLTKEYNYEITGNVIGKITKVLFNIYSSIGYSITLDIIALKDKFQHYKKELEKLNDIQKEIELIKKMNKELKEEIKNNYPDFYDFIESGAAKGWGQIFNMLTVKGHVAGLTGDIELVSHGIADGFTPITFFKGGNPARMGLGNRALSTAKSGYLTRKLIYAMNSVTLSERYANCNTDNYLEIYVTKDIAKRLKGRYFKWNLKETELKHVYNPEEIENKTIFLRSPIFCRAKDGICKTCYGDLFTETKTTKIGILAAQVLGERTTNLLMKSFHTGGTVNISVIDILDLISRVNHNLNKDVTKKFLRQDNVKIIAKMDYYIEIDKIEYDSKQYRIAIDEEGKTFIELEFLIGRIIVPKLNLKEDIHANTIIKYYPSEIKKTEYGYQLYFKKGDIWTIDTSLAGEMNAVISVLLSLIEKKNKITNPKYLLMELHRLYETATDADLVHLELIVSQIMRNPEDPSIPARLTHPYKGICVGIKNIPFYESWISGLLFENINKALEFGLLQDHESKDTPLTNLFFSKI